MKRFEIIKGQLFTKVTPAWRNWDSADASEAPLDLGYDTIGFSTDGRMWDYTAYNDTWTVTAQTKAGFYGTP